MWSRTQNYPNHDDNHISIINRFFDFISNTRSINNRILDQNDNLAEMSYEMILAYLYSSRYSNSNTSNNNSYNTSNTNTNTNTSNTSRRSRSNRRTNSRSAVRSNIRNSLYQSRNDWRNINRRNHTSNTRNVRPRNINNNNVISRQNNLQSPISNIIPMFGSIGFGPSGPSGPSVAYNSLPNTLEHIFHQALQPVTIRPTPQQISRATEERIFDQISEPMNDRCPITRNRFNNNDTVLQILECRHCFHPQSLRTWFETSVRCPICRYDIREYNPLNVINNPYNNSSNTQNTDETTEPEQPEESREDTTNSQDIARELVMNELNNINNDPNISDQQRNIANIISQSMSIPSTNNEELVQTESSIDSNGNLNLTYQFGINLPSNQDQSNIG